MPDVQIAVGLRWKPRNDLPAILATSDVLANDLTYEVFWLAFAHRKIAADYKTGAIVR